MTAVVLGQEEVTPDKDKKLTEEQKRQREEMSSKDDADTTKPELEAEGPVTGLCEDAVEFYGSLRVVAGTEGSSNLDSHSVRACFAPYGRSGTRRLSAGPPVARRARRSVEPAVSGVVLIALVCFSSGPFSHHRSDGGSLCRAVVCVAGAVRDSLV